MLSKEAGLAPDACHCGASIQLGLQRGEAGQGCATPEGGERVFGRAPWPGWGTRASPGPQDPSVPSCARRKRLQPGCSASLTVMDAPRLWVPAGSGGGHFPPAARQAGLGPLGLEWEFRAASGQVASLLNLALRWLFLQVTLWL